MTDEAIIAYLPESDEWCKDSFPHMTLVYAGPLESLQETGFNALAKDAISAARVTGPFSLSVTEVRELGEGEDTVDALILYPTPQLLLARKIVEHWNRSEFKEFLPHATIGPAGSAFVNNVPYYDNGYGGDVSDSRYQMMKKSALPDRLYFNRIAVCWGEQKLVFNTNSF